MFLETVAGFRVFSGYFHNWKLIFSKLKISRHGCISKSSSSQTFIILKLIVDFKPAAIQTSANQNNPPI